MPQPHRGLAFFFVGHALGKRIHLGLKFEIVAIDVRKK